MRKLAKFFNRKQKYHFNDKILKRLGEDIAHELRTPLMTIKVGINGVKACMDKLINAYQIALDNKLHIPEILPQEITSLNLVLNNCEKEADYANSYVNLLSANLAIEVYQQNQNQPLSIKQCIKKTFYSYPQRTKFQKAVLSIDFNFDDFVFFGNELTTIQVFSNLINHALYAIERIGDGYIDVTTKLNEVNNQVIFSNTSKWISKKQLAKLFDGFYPDSPHAGLGLYFCKQIMQSIQGGVDCCFLDNKIMFILSFPKILTKTTVQ